MNQRLLTHYHGISPLSPNGKNALMNPERGLRFEFVVPQSRTLKYHPPFLSDYPFEQYRTDGVAIAQAYVYLSDFTECDLPEWKLQDIERQFEIGRRQGVKFLLRFAYEHNDESMPFVPGPTLERILRHMDQLQDLVARNADVIYVLQSGFIGLWGEFHTSVHGIEKDYRQVATLMNRVLDFLPPNRFTQMRRIRYKENYLKEINAFHPVTLQNAYSSDPAARIGFFNDGTLAAHHDGATFPDPPYSNPGNDEFDTVCRESAYLPVDGELFWTSQLTDPKSISGLRAAIRFTQHRYTTFSYVHSFSQLDHSSAYSTIDAWKDETITPQILNANHLPCSDSYFHAPRTAFEYLRDHLGYRLELQTAEWDSRVEPGKRLSGELNLMNRGFAAPVNNRTCYLVLSGSDGSAFEFPLACNWRSFQPHRPGDESRTPLLHSVKFDFPLPADMPRGEYRVALWMPDPLPSIRNLPRYCVRLANDLPFTEDSDGRALNELGTLTVF